jgi:hypothetical protein
MSWYHRYALAFWCGGAVCLAAERPDLAFLAAIAAGVQEIAAEVEGIRKQGDKR